jgi:threonine/homoserine/homoserine lactone efflux protein
MPPLETSAAFFGASVLLALAPGPDNVFVLMQSAVAGPRGGLAVVAGLCTGLVFHTLAVALGLAAVMAASPLAFDTLRLAGAAYLAWLAWLSFRAGDAAPGTREAGERSGGALYRRGIMMNVTNPKVSIFFLAFLPQFVSVDAGPVAPQVAWFGVLFMVATLLVFGAIAFAAGKAGALLQGSASLRRALNWSAATVFLLLAVRLLWFLFD